MNVARGENVDAADTSRPTAAVLVTGSELLTGHVRDANGPYLARELVGLGFEIAELMLVGDRPEDLRAALEFVAGSGVRLVVTSGGLGPTADDLTADVVAGFCGVTAHLDEALQKRIHDKVAGWASRAGWDGPALDAATRKQSMVPEGAAVLEPVGTAPGLVLTRGDAPTVIVLPGPPRELQGMWPSALAAEPIAELLATVPRAESQLLRFFGLPESEIAVTLTDLDAEHSRVEVTTCLRRSELEVDLHPYPGAEDESARLAEAIVGRHARNLISDDGTSTDDLLGTTLADRGWTVATGESCTGGLLAGRLVDRPGSSAYVAGGVVAYSNEAKTSQLGVPAEMIAEHGAVSPEVARALADGARERFGADVGIGITGVAGPDGGTEAKPVGYVCFCVTTADGQVIARDPTLPGGRADVRERSVDTGMHMLLRAVGALPHR